MGAITQFSINDTSVALNADGTFLHLVSPDFGMNLIIARLKDAGGYETQSVQSFFYSPVWNPRDPHDPDISTLNEALYFWLGRQALDDGDHDFSHINDLATVAELLVASTEIGPTTNPEEPVNSFDAPGLGTFYVHLTDVRLGTPTVTLTPQTGGLRLNLSYTSLEADLEFRQPGPTVGSETVYPAMASASPLLIEADIGISTSEEGGVEVTASEAHVTLENFGVALNLDNDSLEEAINTVLDIGIIKLIFVDQIETAFEEQLSSVLEELVAGSLNSTAFEFEGEFPPLMGNTEPTTLRLKSSPTSAGFTALGGTLGFAASSLSDRAIYYPTFGSISTQGCLKESSSLLWFDPSYSIAVAISDDFINQMIFSAWWGGALQFPIPQTEDGVGQLARLGITDMEIEVDLLHAPVLSSCNPDGALRIQIGDMKTRLILEIAEVEEVGLNVFTSLEADVNYRIIETEEGPVISLEFTTMRKIETEVVLDDPGLTKHRAALQEFIEGFFIDALIENLTSDNVIGFPIPEIDLSTVEGIPPGHTLNLDVSRIERLAHYTVILGDPAEDPAPSDSP